MLVFRQSFEWHIRTKQPALIFGDVLTEDKGIAVLRADMGQSFRRDRYRNDVNRKLPLPPNGRKLHYQIAGVLRKIVSIARCA